MTIDAKCLLKQDLRISNISEEAIITLQQLLATLANFAPCLSRKIVSFVTLACPTDNKDLITKEKET